MKRYVIRKFINANSMQEALRLDRKHKPSEIYEDEREPDEKTPLIGFNYNYEEDEF
jgi:hypothetical protein